MPAKSSSYMSEVRPPPARQQHEQIVLEKVVRDRRRDQRRREDDEPAALAAWRIEQRLERRHERERRDAEAEPRQEPDVEPEHREAAHDERIVRPLAGGRLDAPPREEVLDDESRAQYRGDAEHDPRIEARPDRHERARLQVEREIEKNEARREYDEPRDAVAADHRRGPRATASSARGLW